MGTGANRGGWADGRVAVVSLLLTLVVLVGCVEKPEDPPKPVAAVTTPEIQHVSRSEAALRAAEKLADSDLPRAIEIAERGVSQNETDETAVQLLLLTGQLESRYEKEYRQALARESSSRKAREAVAAYERFASRHPEQFLWDEPGGVWLYNGAHFRQIVRQFPRSELADDAAWELTRLTRTGECDGIVECRIEQGFTPLAQFMVKYPESAFVPQAVERVDETFRAELPADRDLNVSTAHFDPTAIRTLLGRYDQIAGLLPPPSRARAYETIADLYVRLGNPERARYLYQSILDEVPNYEHAARVRGELQHVSASAPPSGNP